VREQELSQVTQEYERMCFKYDELMRQSQVPSNVEKSAISLNQYASNQSRVQNVNQQKTLPLKQLRDII
jgi:hypothetical protein